LQEMTEQLQRLELLGELKPGVKERAIGKSIKDMADAIPDVWGETSRAVTRGSAAEASMMARAEQAVGGPYGDPTERILAKFELQRQATEKSNALLSDIARRFSGGMGITGASMGGQ